MNCFAVDGKIISVIKGRREQRSKVEEGWEVNRNIKVKVFSPTE